VRVGEVREALTGAQRTSAERKLFGTSRTALPCLLSSGQMTSSAFAVLSSRSPRVCRQISGRSLVRTVAGLPLWRHGLIWIGTHMM
jgi:hypothetical protein